MKKTPLNDIHRQAGARMVEFGGWDMPVQYSGVIAEHLAVRTSAGLFDVSHMGEIEVTGSEAEAFVQYVTTNDASKLVDGQVQYTALCYDNGGVVDDLTLYRFDGQRYLLCVNASNSDKDYAWLREVLDRSDFSDCQVINRSSEFGQLALQGPQAAEILAQLTATNLADLKYYHFCEGQVAGMQAIISRTGYTGEDGFELYCASDDVAAMWLKLMAAGDDFGLVPVGLGARDTLRLEKGYALYGHEITADIIPLEARLAWIVKLDKGDFVGRDAMLKAKEQGIKRQLIALKLQAAGVPREGYPVYRGDEEIGYVTSGTQSPSLKQGVALALVDKSAAAGEQFEIAIRKRRIAAEKTKLPFV